tara:strand:+ start:141 stop:518 length:378 start_codon:yes stop_codon:yes gene_type:complete
MIIKDMTEKELKLGCLDIITKTVVELGQSKDDKTLTILASSLYEDLLDMYSNMHFEDIVKAFHYGVRNTDIFLLSVQNYNKWIKSHRQLIWNESSKEPERLDKRLKYRTKIGTGMKKISNIKLIK